MIGEGIGLLADLFCFFFLHTLSLKTIPFNFVETVEKDRIAILFSYNCFLMRIC